MILLLDAGNTRVKWAVWGPQGWEAKGAVSLDRMTDMGRHWTGLEPTWIGVSCVAAPAVAEALGRLLAGFAAPVYWLRSMARGFGIRNGYALPEQLGGDRFAMLVACQGLGLGPCVVAGAGTAVTVDALAPGGEHLGGIILPGLGLMRAALLAGTAGVEQASGTPGLFPIRTGDGVETGIRLAAQGAILEMHRRLEQRIAGQAGIILTGGDVSLLAPDIPCQIREDLVLEGLRRIALELGATRDLEA